MGCYAGENEKKKNAETDSQDKQKDLPIRDWFIQIRHMACVNRHQLRSAYQLLSFPIREEGYDKLGKGT